MKYISVDYIVDICQANIIPLKAHHQSVAVSALRRVMEAVKEDAVEAEPVKHGRWMYPFYCSECAFVPYYSSDITYYYCPNCGAKNGRRCRLMAQISINYGAISAPIEEQLNEQGFTLDAREALLVEKMAYGLVLNHVHGILTDSAYDRALQRLHKRIISQIKTMDGGISNK